MLTFLPLNHMKIHEPLRLKAPPVPSIPVLLFFHLSKFLVALPVAMVSSAKDRDMREIHIQDGSFLKKGYPPVIIHSFDFPNIQLLGYPHLYGTPHIYPHRCIPLLGKAVAGLWSQPTKVIDSLTSAAAAAAISRSSSAATMSSLGTHRKVM